MKETSVPFKIQIAKPCPARWEDMGGDDRSRYCDLCKKNVYNISAMPAAEATALIQAANGRMCVRICQRADGTVLTEDCPVGIARQWRRAKTFAAAALGTVLFAMVSVTALGRGNTTPSSRNEFRDRVMVKFDDAKWAVKGWFGLKKPAQPNCKVGDMLVVPPPAVVGPPPAQSAGQK
jgi:hypothetical protein